MVYRRRPLTQRQETEVEAATARLNELHAELPHLNYPPSHSADDIATPYTPLRLDMSTITTNRQQLAETRAEEEESEAEWQRCKPKNMKQKRGSAKTTGPKSKKHDLSADKADGPPNAKRQARGRGGKTGGKSTGRGEKGR